MWPLRVNRIADKIPQGAASETAAGGRSGLEPYLIVAAMFTYSILLGLSTSPVSFGAGVAVSTLAYFIGIYLYYGVARLAFAGRNYLLWSCGVLAFVISYTLTGLSGLWPLLTGWSMILFAGTLMGRYSQSGYNQYRVYMIGLVTVVVFSMAQSIPIWKETMVIMYELIEKFVNDARQNLVTLGYGVDVVRQNIDSAENMLKGMVRLIPSLMVLGAVVPFSVAYLIFSHRLDKTSYAGKTMAPFAHWKMPFALTPVLIVAIFMRIVGGETLVLTADNVLAFLGIFYSITGMALMEFYLRKLNFSTIMKMMFYIVFFLSQFVGLFVAAFLGFIDSFVDWRKVQQLSLEEK